MNADPAAARRLDAVLDPQQAAVLALQRQAGNRAVAAMLAGQLPLQRRKGAIAPDRAHSEKTSVDVTGFYEAQEAGAGNRILLQINQAGRHIEGWWEQHRARGWGNEQDITQHRITGDIASDHEGSVSFAYQRLNSAGKLASEGLLTAWMEGGAIDLQLLEGSWAKSFSRTDNAPRIAPEAVSAMPGDVKPLVKATQEVPLDTAEHNLIYLTAVDLAAAVTRYYSETRGIGRTGRATAVNLIVREKMGVFTAEQRPAAIRELRSYLAGVDVTSGSVTRPVWDWLEVIAAVDPDFTPALQQYLGFKGSGIQGPEAAQHKYRWTMKVLGAAADLVAEVSGYIGEFTISKLSPDTWSTDYFTVLGGLSAGLQAGIKVKLPLKAARGQASTPNDFESPFPWTSGNFAGGYTMFQGAAKAGLGAGGSYSKGFIIFSGDGTYPAVQAPADSWSFEIVFGAGVGVGGTGGWMWGGKDEAVRYAKEQQAIEARSAPQSVAATHFAVDDPSLNGTGRQAIRVMSALHRAEFENKDSTLSIDGYASPTGSHARNQLLSELRAKNVLQGIRDALGPAFHLPAGNVSVEGHGEGPALKAGVPRGVESREWRRVDITLNGKVVLSLD